MRLFRVPMIVVVPLVLAAGCAQAAGPSATGPSASVTTTASAGAGSPTTGSGSPTGSPGAVEPAFRVVYGWAVPSSRVEVPHEVHAPITPPPGIPLPYLVEIHVGDHPEGTPAYQRISFYFRGGFPAYNLQYVREVLTEGKGDRLPLPGNSFLRIQFAQAQAHDQAGQSTVRTAPTPQIGLSRLRGYGFAGDFEGYVSYGLGIQVASGSDQVLPIRVGELTKPDGAGGTFSVIAFDVRAG